MNNILVTLFCDVRYFIRLVLFNTPSFLRWMVWKLIYIPLSRRAYFIRLGDKRKRLCETDVNSVAARFCRFRGGQIDKRRRDRQRKTMEDVARKSTKTGIPQHVLLSMLDYYGITGVSSERKWFNDSYSLFGHPFLNKWACKRCFMRFWKPVSKWIEDHIDQFQYDWLVEHTLMKGRKLTFPQAYRISSKWVCFQYYRKKRLENEIFLRAWGEWNVAHGRLARTEEPQETVCFPDKGIKVGDLVNILNHVHPDVGPEGVWRVESIFSSKPCWDKSCFKSGPKAELISEDSDGSWSKVMSSVADLEPVKT